MSKPKVDGCSLIIYGTCLLGVIIWLIQVALSIVAVLIGLLFVFIIPITIAVLAFYTYRSFRRGGCSIIQSFLITAFAISTGTISSFFLLGQGHLSGALGVLYPVSITGLETFFRYSALVSATGFALAVISTIIRRSRELRKYRQYERLLIDP